MVERLFLAVPRGCLQFVIVVFPDHTHLLFFISICKLNIYVSLSASELTVRLARHETGLSPPVEQFY